MEGMEQKLGEILGNPQMMQQIMAMAQALGGGAEQNTNDQPHHEQPSLDPSVLQKLSGLMGNSNVDSQEQNLLSALSPYIARDRIQKLEKAMRAAKMARLASSFLNSGGLQLLTGR